MKDPRYDGSPLNQRDYEPAVKPSGGTVPAVVEKLGPRSQVRWFHRFRAEVGWRMVAVWDRFYCSSVEHKGQCCDSCLEDDMNGYGSGRAECCCRALREKGNL